MRFLLCLFSFSMAFHAGKAQLFSQSFNGATSIGDYVQASSPSTGQFTFAAAAGANGSIDISNKKVRLIRKSCTGPHNSCFARTANFAATAPALLKMTFTMNAVCAITNLPTPPAVLALFNIGAGFTNDYASNSTTTHTRFAVYTDSASTGRFRIMDNHVAASATVQSPWFVDEQSFTLVSNNSGTARTYTGPDGNSYTVANDKWDMWAGTNRFFTGVAAAGAGNDLQNFKLLFYSNSGMIAFDDLVFTALP
ncbi:hypothetical protein [Paraflavitalea pollutisoli]|uniref:hypothetical protein n=1 Tax=Paraflavitalea pollutisoli TaxID=3034143 RepID=UPI0023EBD6DE|nr:hypothetical protein [Paraflavitalea sp. H1-2-19X]